MIKDYRSLDLFDRMIFEKVIFVPPFRFSSTMPNDACFFYAIRGKSLLHGANEHMPLQTSEGVVLRCGNYLNEWLKIDDSAPCEALAIHFYPEVLRKIYDRELPDFIKEIGNTKRADIQKVKADALLKNYIKSLLFYFENPELVSDELLKLKLKELILLLAKTDNAAAIMQLMSSLFTPNEYSLREVVEANIYHNLSLDELALLCKMSLSSFKREFRKVYQISPAKYLKIRKLERAAELLKSTRQRIGDIAFDCGFREVAHFSKSFQKQFGVSPSDFRLAQTDK